MPWFIEAQVRFAGFFSRLKESSRLAGGKGGWKTFLWHLRGLDGPLYQPKPSGEIPSMGLVWVISLALMAISGVVIAKRYRKLSPLLVCFLVILSFMVGYFIFAGVARPRYLLPIYALMAIPAGFFISIVIEKCSPHLNLFGKISAILLMIFLIIPLGKWHFKVLKKISYKEYVIRKGYLAVAIRIKKQINGRPCTLATHQVSGPPIIYQTGCRGKVLFGKDFDSSLSTLFKERACEGDAVFYLTRRQSLPEKFYPNWQGTKVGKSLKVYEPSQQGTAYCKALDLHSRQ